MISQSHLFYLQQQDGYHSQASDPVIMNAEEDGSTTWTITIVDGINDFVDYTINSVVPITAQALGSATWTTGVIVDNTFTITANGLTDSRIRFALNLTASDGGVNITGTFGVNATLIEPIVPYYTAVINNFNPFSSTGYIKRH